MHHDRKVRWVWFIFWLVRTSEQKPRLQQKHDERELFHQSISRK
jgi:hypothetical protein